MTSLDVLDKNCLVAFKECNYSEAIRLLSLVSKPEKLFTVEGERILGLLHLAAKNGWLDVVKDLIINYNIEPTQGGSYVYTIHIAVEYNQLDIVKYLTLEYGCYPIMADKRGWELYLHKAVTYNDAGFVKYLITNCDPLATEKLELYLRIAVKQKCLHVIKYLITECNCNPMVADDNGMTCLDIAEENHFDIVAYLIAGCGCDPMIADKNRRNFLHFAVEKDQIDTIKYLITKCRCDPMVADGDGRNCLHIAVENGHIDVIKYLITECRCDPMVADEDGMNCLHIAVEKNFFDIGKYLITECSCNPMVADRNGNNCVHIAVAKNHFDIVRFLMKCSCDPMVADRNGKNCLYIALEKKYLDIVKYLIIKCSCDPMVADEDGRNCLHIAVLFRRYSVIEYLLSAGTVDPLAKDNYNITPVAYAKEYPDILSLFRKFGRIKASYPVDSYVNVLLLGNPGVGKSTLAQVIIERANGTLPFARLRKVKSVEPFTAGIIPTKLQHKELGNIILHDFAGHSEYYSSHTAVIENLLQGSGAVFVIVVDITSEDSTKHLQQWLTVVNNEIHKCISQCHIIVALSHVDEMADNILTMNERKEKLSEVLTKRCDSPYSLVRLNCRKFGGNKMSSLFNELSSSCKSIRSRSGNNLSLYCHMMYAFLEESEPNIFSLSDILTSPLKDQYVLPNKIQEIFEILTSLHSTGLVCLLKSHDDPNKVWVVVNKQILLADLNGILFAPKSFKEFRNIASNTGIITVPSFISFFHQYDPDMLICFLKHMELCQEINPQFLTMTNLKANSDEGEDKLLFFPTLLDIDRPEGINGKVFKFGWYLQCTEDYHFFPSYYFHVLILHLAYNYGLSKSSSKFDRHCTFWKNGIHWFDGNGVETLVEMINDSQCIQVLISCEEGYEENMVSLLSRVVKKVMELQIESCPSLKPSKFVLDPNELEYPIDKPTQRTVYNISDILTSIGDRTSFVISETFQDGRKLPKEIKIGEILKSATVTTLKSILEGHDLKESTLFINEETEMILAMLPPPLTLPSLSLPPSPFTPQPLLPQLPPLLPPTLRPSSNGSKPPKVTQDLLNMGDLDDVLTFLKSHQFANHQWQDLGIHMGLYKPTLEDIDDKCRGDPRKCLRECVAAWLKGEDKVMNKGGPSSTSLADALHAIGEHKMAIELWNSLNIVM